MMAVPENIEELAHQIRTAIYGRDVRESMASGLEATADVADWSRRVAQDIIDGHFDEGELKTEIERKLNELETEYAPKLTSIENEIKNARGSEPSIGDRLNSVNTQLADIVSDHSLSPDYYIGSDKEKIEQALVHVLEKGGGTIRLPRMFDITGEGSIFLNKINADDRRSVTFESDGGGITKHDSGFIFDGDVNNSGDWNFDKILFQSTQGAGTAIFNADRLIRVAWDKCHARNVDNIVKAEERYLQTYSFNGGSVIGGNGWAFSSPCYYDVSFSGGFFAEHREHFLRQTKATVGTWQAMNGVYFKNAMVEGLRGKAFEILRTENFAVDGLYLENNKGGHFDFSGADYLDGVSLDNMRVSEPQDTLLTSAIKWGGQLRGVSTRNIFARNIPIHDTTSVVMSVNYNVYSYQDVAMDHARNPIANIDDNNQVVLNNLNDVYQPMNNAGSYKMRDYTSTTDFNNIVLSGAYHMNGGSSPNSPLVGWGVLEVQTHTSNFILQKFYGRGSSTGHIYIRFRENMVWTEWKYQPPLDGMFTFTNSSGEFINRYTSTTDFNSVILSGAYHMNAGSSPNSPASSWGILEVQDHGSYIMQRYSSRGSGTGNVYVRFRENGTWTPWRQTSSPVS